MYVMEEQLIKKLRKGDVIGTLSSLFVAAPVAYLTMGHKMKDTEKAEA